MAMGVAVETGWSLGRGGCDMITRRQFLKGTIVAGTGAVVLPRMSWSAALAASQTPMSAGTIPQFVDPLPDLDVIVAGSSRIELRMREFMAQVLPTGLPKTSVWGYLQPGQHRRASYLGPVIVATRGVPTEIKWVNELGTARRTNLVAWTHATDQTIHWADPLHDEANVCAEAVEPSQPPTGYCARNYSGPVPAVAHLHGGEVPSVLDGGPDAWFTSDGKYVGHAFYSGDGLTPRNYSIFRYPNVQESAPVWFHDHALGLTRLNVYAGLAGAYLITDPPNDPPNLPPLTPLVIQDRMFDTAGQLFFPAGVPYIPNPEHPYWVPEFIGDTVAVNGKVWPYLEVERKRYRFLFLNGSNARGYELFLTNEVTKADGPAMWQIATDGGYLDTPVKIDPKASRGALQRLLLLPGERAEVIVDFGQLVPGTRLLLRNIAKAPFPGGEAPDGRTTGRIMELRVVPSTGADTTYDPASGAPLRAPMVRLVDPAAGALAPGVTVQVTRQLTLNEVLGPPSEVDGVSYPGGPLEILVNNTEYPGSPRPDFTPITTGGKTTYYSELPHEGATEIWEIVNLTADAHPIHLHLVQFQPMNRQSFDVPKYSEVYAKAFPGGTDPMTGQSYPPGVYIPGFGPPLDYQTGNQLAVGGNPDITPFLKGPVKPPAPNEAGWKDTVVAPPGDVTRIVVRWAPTDLPAATDPGSASYPFDPDGGHGYVWHCHIIDHEDNEMMRPTSVRSNTVERTYRQGVDY